ncbi:MAG: DNA primase, partial [Vallitaleaceae bacterium]|nr:DNA primase [Vallitaleaceae bacterium]
MYYPDEVIEEVRLNSDVVDVIGSYVHLQKKGSSYFGLCPFHHEKSPSFSVSKDKQMYYCFGCGAGGNVISFIMAYENYSFVEALRFLADRAHITLPEAEITEEMRSALNYKQRLYDTNRQAAVFYYRMLYSDVGKNALAYFDQRGVDEEIRKKFALGYATFMKDDLMNYLLSKGFTKKEMLDCGLISEDKGRSGAYHNRFFNRIMFPILDVHGRVIAFGGRVMGEGEPKYLNSPETTLFDKSRNLYGLHLARKSKNHQFLIIVEGYMDVIALHQAGFDNAIAALGTSFTSGHGQLIKRYADEVVLCFDSDSAGVKASLRAIPILKSSGLVVRVLQISEYKDPDEYIQKKGKESFEELLKTAIPSFMFEIRMLSQNYDLK